MILHDPFGVSVKISKLVVIYAEIFGDATLSLAKYKADFNSSIEKHLGFISKDSRENHLSLGIV